MSTKISDQYENTSDKIKVNYIKSDSAVKCFNQPTLEMDCEFVTFKQIWKREYRAHF